MTRDEFLALLYQALGEPIGLLLQCSNPGLARQRLYAARASARDPALGGLQIRMSPFPEGNLVICKGQTPLPGQLQISTSNGVSDE